VAGEAMTRLQEATVAGFGGADPQMARSSAAAVATPKPTVSRAAALQR
jgi:erythromycin esterase-like protein